MSRSVLVSHWFHFFPFEDMIFLSQCQANLISLQIFSWSWREKRELLHEWKNQLITIELVWNLQDQLLAAVYALWRVQNTIFNNIKSQGKTSITEAGTSLRTTAPGTPRPSSTRSSWKTRRSWGSRPARREGPSSPWPSQMPSSNSTKNIIRANNKQNLNRAFVKNIWKKLVWNLLTSLHIIWEHTYNSKSVGVFKIGGH